MPDEKLSLPETAALVVLMREAREVSNPELKKIYGLTIDGEGRRRLNELKLVESRRQGRSFVHVLTDTGWARLGEEFRRGLPRHPGSAGAMVQALSGGLQHFMDRTGGRLADVFAPSGNAAPAASPVPAAEPEPPPLPAPSAGSSEVEALIRSAYARLAGRPGTWVGIAELRAMLGEVCRRDVDDALRRMNLMEGVSIVPESNRKVLSARDHEAAVTIGDQAKHLLWIGAC